MAISGQFFTNYINTFPKTEVQTTILRYLTYQKPNWINSYAIKHKFCPKLFFFNFVKKGPENLHLINGSFQPFLVILMPTT